VDYRLLYTQSALSDLAEIIGHIAEDDGEAASRFGKSLLDHVELLTDFPRMGGTIRKRSRVRKLAHSPILVYYQVREDKHVVEVLHFRHGSRTSPKF
jgi:plasmid stabilization system protein ParE